MTIHHDKMAYGKLAKTGGEIPEEELLKMIKELNGEEEVPEKQTPPPVNKKRRGKD